MFTRQHQFPAKYGVFFTKCTPRRISDSGASAWAGRECHDIERGRVEGNSLKGPSKRERPGKQGGLLRLVEFGCERLHRVNEAFDYVPQKDYLAPDFGVGRYVGRRRVSGASPAPGTSPSVAIDAPFCHPSVRANRRP